MSEPLRNLVADLINRDDSRHPEGKCGYCDEAREADRKKADAIIAAVRPKDAVTAPAAWTVEDEREVCAKEADILRAQHQELGIKNEKGDYDVYRDAFHLGGSAAGRDIAAAIRARRTPAVTAPAGSAEWQAPVAWRVKDFAGGWILYQDKIPAQAESDATGALLQPLYAAPPPVGRAVKATNAMIRAARNASLAVMSPAPQQEDADDLPDVVGPVKPGADR